MVVVVAFLNIVSTPGPGFVRVKVRFAQVGDLVGQVKDQVCQGQGQELDNKTSCDKRRQKFALFG